MQENDDATNPVLKSTPRHAQAFRTPQNRLEKPWSDQLREPLNTTASVKKRSTSAIRIRALICLVLFFAGVCLTLFAASDPPKRGTSLAAQLRRVNGAPLAPRGGVQESWVAHYNGPGDYTDQATAIAVDSSGNVYVTGESSGQDAIGYATIKYNSAGEEQWVARYNGPGNGNARGNAIAVDVSGNVYVTGESLGQGTGNDYATIKYNSAGQEQWVVRYNGPASLDDYATGIAVDTSGNVYVTGESDEVDYASDYATIKYDSNGQQQWVSRYNGPANDEDFAEAIAVDSSGNVYVTGGSVGQGTRSDFATIKYSSTGQEQWVIRYNGPANGDDQANAMTVDASGNVYVTGQSFDPNNGDDYVTIKYAQGTTPSPTPPPTATPRPTPTPRSRPASHPRPTARD